MLVAHARESRDFVRALTKGYAVLILIFLSLTPSFPIAYLHFFQNPGLRFEHHAFHEIAIGVALLQSGFITYVTWRCYRHSGEPFLRWLTVGFLGFTLIYGLHGAFTRTAHDNVGLFLLYGPAARLMMGGCLLAGLMAYGRQVQTVAQRSQGGYWLVWILVFAAINALVFALAFSAWESLARLALEVSAMCLMLACVATLIVRRIRSPLMTIYMLSLLFFAQSSLAFMMGSVWNHQWWLAHAVFTTGFIVLSYGVIQVFLTTGSFTTVYSQVELMEQIWTEKVRAKELEILAATDPLTGAANRRVFTAQAAAEIARAMRSRAPLSILLVDLDHFKQINDRYGHPVGDKVLAVFVATAKKLMRTSDFVGRLGGEEFAILLPDTMREGAGKMAERLRRIVENETIKVDGADLRFTASFGVAQLGLDGNTYESMIEVADSRMYQAKQEGRNRVVVQ